MSAPAHGFVIGLFQFASELPLHVHLDAGSRIAAPINLQADQIHF